MKTTLLLATFATFSLTAPLLFAADTATPAPAPATHGQGNFLSAEDKAKFDAAKTKALADNPDLKTEQEALTKSRPAKGAAKEDRQAFKEKMTAFQQKLRAAMLKEDSSLQPIFDQMDKHEAEMRAKRAAAGQ